MKTGTWTFEKQTLMRPSGINLAEPNFTRENKKIVRLFEREFYQNVIDARCEDLSAQGKKKRAHITVKILDAKTGLDLGALRHIFAPLEDHLVNAGHPHTQRKWEDPRVLVIEEFNTVGLTGSVNNSRVEGEAQRWANFWFGEGKRSKTGGSLGRQGQGKITYHIISGARAVIALTQREHDKTPYLFGKCIVRHTHQVKGIDYTHHGYWPKMSGEQPLPESDPDILKTVSKAFDITRKNESGTSWIIPFIPDNFTSTALLQEFVGDFFFSILNGDITADICGRAVNSSNIEAIFAELKIEEPSQLMFTFLTASVTQPESEFIESPDGWDTGNNIPESVFKSAHLESLREDFHAGKVVSVKLPVLIYPKASPPVRSFVKVHIQTGENIPKVEELYVRSGLPIADEEHLKDVTHKAFGMVLAADRPIAEFLGYCELASHLKWNSGEEEAKDRYNNILETLSAVRKSLPKLFRLLAGTSDSLVEDALDDILYLPSTGNIKKKGTKKRRVKTPKLPRPPAPQIYTHSDKPGGWELSPGPHAKEASYPHEVIFRFAYDRLDGTGNPWSMWHPFDFDLSSENINPATEKNIKIINREGQDLKLRILNPAFKLLLSGFSKDQPLLIKRL